MWNAHSKVRQTWFRLWAVVALLMLTWSAGGEMADRFFTGAAAATHEAAQPAATQSASVARPADAG